LSKIALKRPEKYFPLKVLVCEICWLVQAEAYSRAAELFNEEYAYFSSISTEWLSHAKKYVDQMIERFSLGESSLIGEVAANDGYLLQYVNDKGISCFGIEPTASTATVARQKGLEIIQEFLTLSLAKDLRSSCRTVDLLVANNVLAHVPEINDFTQSCQLLLKANGVLTCEFPHLLNLVSQHQFDTIYHEHFSYLSFGTVVDIFVKNGLQVFDVEKLGTHGGSLRVFAQRSDTGSHLIEPSVEKLLGDETRAGIHSLDFYRGLQQHAEKVKDDFLNFLLDKKREGKIVVGYGAAAKANTLLNFAGVRLDLIRYIVDRNPHKQGKFMPGSRIPIVSEDHLKIDMPDFVIIFPWNIRDEVTKQLRYLRECQTTFVVAVPNLELIK